MNQRTKNLIFILLITYITLYFYDLNCADCFEEVFEGKNYTTSKGLLGRKKQIFFEALCELQKINNIYVYTEDIFYENFSLKDRFELNSRLRVLLTKEQIQQFAVEWLIERNLI